MNYLDPPHDWDDPRQYLNGLEMARYLAEAPPCPHCHAHGELLPMTGTAWGIEWFHEDDCPDHDDNLPTPGQDGNTRRMP